MKEKKPKTKEHKIIDACIAGEVLAIIGIIVLGTIKMPIPEIVMKFYGLCMAVAFAMIVILIIKSKK